MSEPVSIQWFPGHMAKTRRLIQENLKLVDAVVEITDARIPQSSRNPELRKWVENKPGLLILNKADEADEKATALWLRYYQSIGVSAIAADCKSGRGLQAFLPMVQRVLHELQERRKAKGMAGHPLRLMVVGIPNAGKSSFINRMAKAKKTQVEDRPGVTRSQQWVKLDGNTELLDMPGVLWPKFEDPLVGERLAFTGAVKDDVMDLEALACRLLSLLYEAYPELMAGRFKLETGLQMEGYELLQMVGKKRGMLLSGGEINTERAAATVLDEFRAGKIGRITLELPPNGTEG